MQGLGKTPGLGMTPDTAHAAGRTGVAATGFLSSTLPAAASFRSGWQSLLASLSSGMAVSGEDEADQGTASAAAIAGEISGKSSASTQAAGIRLRQGQGTEKECVESGAVTKLSSPGAGTQALAAEPAAVVAQPASTRVEEKKLPAEPGTEPETESVSSSRPARTTNTTKADAVPADALPGLVPAAMASLSQTVPATVISSQVAQNREDPAQLSYTEISAAFSTNQPITSASASPTVASATFATQTPGRETPSNHAAAANSAVQQIAEGYETPAQQTQASTVSNLNSTSGSILSETESAVADKDTPPAVAKLAEGGNRTESPAPARSLYQSSSEAATRNASPAETLARRQESSQTYAQNDIPIQPLAPSTSLSATLATNQTSSSTLAPEQSLMQTSSVSQSLTSAAAPRPVSSSAFAPEQSLMQTSSVSQSLTPAAAPRPVSSSTLAPGQTQTQASVPSQAAETNLNSSEIPAASQVAPPIFVSGQNQTHPLAPGPTPIRIAAPSLNPIPSQVASHSLTPATAPNTNPVETQETSTSSTPVLVPDLNRTSTFVPSLEQVAIQQGNQGVNGFAGDGLNPTPLIAGAAAQSGLLAAQPLALSKPGSAASGKTLTPESIRGNGNTDSFQPINHLTAGQSSVPAVDASAMARALAGAGGSVSTPGEQAGTSSVAATGPDSREAFATLDATGAPGATTWIHAGTQRAEAGYQDPALGWVGVRADLSGGGVHAQLVPGSADAAQALGGHLSGLNAYLAEHHTPVETLTLTAPESGWSGLSSGQGTGEGMHQGSGQQTAQGSDASTLSGQSSESAMQSPAASAELPAFFGDMDGITQPATLDGFHISVMA